MNSRKFYCVKCRRKFTQGISENICVEKLRNNKFALVTHCNKCNTKCYRFISDASTETIIKHYGQCKRGGRSRSRSKCGAGKVRSRSTGKCRSKKKPGRKARSRSRSKCGAGKARSRSTGRCRSKKKPGRKARSRY